MVYVRPHLMNIERQPSDRNYLPAWVTHINSAGPLVKVEVETSRGDSIHVEIPHERYRELQLKKNDAVFVSPKDMKIFGASAAH